MDYILRKVSQQSISYLNLLLNGKTVERIGCICALTLSDLGDEVLNMSKPLINILMIDII